MNRPTLMHEEPKIEADGTGIKIIPCDGLKVFVR